MSTRESIPLKDAQVDRGGVGGWGGGEGVGGVGGCQTYFVWLLIGVEGWS